jgi:Phage integrase family
VPARLHVDELVGAPVVPDGLAVPDRFQLPSSAKDLAVRDHEAPAKCGTSEPEASRSGVWSSHERTSCESLLFEAAAKEAKLQGVSFHSLRHAAASRLIAGGLDPVTVAAVLGHEDPTITLKIYSHLYDRQRKDEAVRVALAGGGR